MQNDSRLDPAINAYLVSALQDARARSLEIYADLTPAQLLGPRLDVVNPPLWELGHLAWFQEYWCLRRDGDAVRAPPLIENADALYDSTKVAHATRWDLPLLDLPMTKAYMAQVLERVIERVAQAPERAYFAELALYHEDMHAEAFLYTRQTLGLRSPYALREAPGSLPDTDDVDIAGGDFELGAEDDGQFVFDNEKWAHPVYVAPFRMARCAVSNGEYLRFVEDGGYRNRSLWSPEGWQWRETRQLFNPQYWQQRNGGWFERRYDEWIALDASVALMHVCWYEAQAYCAWAGRRLPSEAEWEFAASTSPQGGARRHYPWGGSPPNGLQANLDAAYGGPVAVSAFPHGDSGWGVRQMLGNVWEWTADTFNPYPGFVADPYREYSQPWFGTHKVLRGGCFATRTRLIRNSWRNFYTPDRNDVFAGFRTCAID